MEAVLTVIYEFKGINSLPQKGEIILPTKGNIRAKVVDHISEEFDFLAIKEVLGNYSLRTIFNRFQPKNPASYLQRKIAKNKRDRKNTFKKGTFLIFQGFTQIQKIEKKKIQIGKFSFYLNAFKKSHFTQKFQREINNCLTTILLSTNEISSFDLKQIGNFAYIENENKKPPTFLFSLTGKGRFSVGSNFPKENVKKLPSRYRELSDDDFLATTIKFFLYSASDEYDEEISYMNCWLSLEKLTNKLFDRFFKTRWLENKDKNIVSLVKKNCVDFKRIEDEKLSNLKDKFLIISAFLNPNSIEDDIKEFSNFYDLRIEIYHRQGFENKELLINGMQKLFKKYLNLFLDQKDNLSPSPPGRK